MITRNYTTFQFRKEVDPPYKPTVTSDMDITNIDPTFTGELPTVTPTPMDAILVDPDAFEGFTYNEGDSYLGQLESFKSMDGETMMGEYVGTVTDHGEVEIELAEGGTL